MSDKFSNDITHQRTYRAFEALATQEDTAIDLVQACLLIASIASPDLDITAYMARFDMLARRVRAALALPPPDELPHLPDEMNTRTVIETMNKILFEEEGFHGNVADYHNADNSFLNKVLDEHVGLPIMLSIIYIEVGKRVGIDVDGIGLPFHFIVRCRLKEGFIYIDPFHGEQLLSEYECLQLLRRIAGVRIKMHPAWFKPVTHRALLTRVLNNLKGVYLDEEDFEHALTICHLLVLLHPHGPTELRDRGIVHFELQHYSHALHDLRAYIQLAPQAQDRDEILNHIKTIRQMIAMMN